MDDDELVLRMDSVEANDKLAILIAGFGYDDGLF